MLSRLKALLPPKLAAEVRHFRAIARGTGPHPQRLRMRSYCRGRGIEIGALHNPLEVGADAHVSYVDRLSTDDLRTHYPELAQHPLVPISVLATAEDLSALPDQSQDFVIANHLLEHTENPLRALREFDRVLKPRGIVYLALPDPRYTFDRDRALTTTEHLVDEFRNGPEKNRFAHYLDYAIKVDHLDEAHARSMMERGYSIHFHVWTPQTFREFFEAARREAGLMVELVDADAGDNEFIFILRKGPSLFDRARKVLPIPRRPAALLRELRSWAAPLA